MQDDSSLILKGSTLTTFPSVNGRPGPIFIPASAIRLIPTNSSISISIILVYSQTVTTTVTDPNSDPENPSTYTTSVSTLGYYHKVLTIS